MTSNEHHSANPRPSLVEMSGEDYKKEALHRAAKERQDIVNKYKNGEDSEDEQDNWVDANAKVYKVTDRYGFLHEEELSDLPSLVEEKRKLTEVKRQFKWVKMLQKWSSYVGTEKLRQRVYKGIPLNLRGDAWRLMLNVAELMENEPTVYQEMKVRSHQHSPDIKQIDMDVNRTYRDHIMFRKRYSIKQQQLFDVLSAYSMYNTEVGYCQGMSQIAALLLMYMSEQEAFWALHSLLYGTKHLMHGFFIPGFPKLMRFQEHHDRILKKMMPRLKKHLDRNEIFASLYTMKWFFQCFLDRSPFPLTLRLWDIYVLEGERLLTAMSYTTLKMHKAVIKKMEMDEVVRFLQEQLAMDFGADDDAVVEQLRLNMQELKRSGMELPPPPEKDEMPKLPFGKKIQPTFEQETGLRSPAQLTKSNQNTSASVVTSSENDKSKKKSKKGKKSNEKQSNGGAVVSASSGSDARNLTSTDEHELESSFEHRSSSDKQRPQKSNRKKKEQVVSSSSSHDKTGDEGKRREKDSGKKTKRTDGEKGSGKKKEKTRDSSVLDESRSSHASGKDREKKNNVTSSSDEPLTAPESQSRDNGHATHSPSKRNSPSKQNSPSKRSSPSKKKGGTPPHLVIPSSTDYTSSGDSAQPHAASASSASSSKGPIIWRAPSPQKTLNATSPGGTSFSSSPVNPSVTSFSPAGSPSRGSSALSTVKNSFSSKSKSYDLIKANAKVSPSRNQASDRSFSEQFDFPPLPTDNVWSTRLRRDEAPATNRQKAGRFPLLSKSRPLSVYDNVIPGMPASEDDFDDVTPDDGDDVTDFEAKMEESLENLRELTDRLSRTPSPLVAFRLTGMPINRNRQQSSNRGTHDPYPRSHSLDLIDDDEIAQMASLGADTNATVAKSASALQLHGADYDNPRPGAAFQKAIVDAGILRALPKPPSSNTLSSLSTAPRKSFITASVKPPKQGIGGSYYGDRPRRNKDWNEVLLDGDNLPTLDRFVARRRSRMDETRPVSVDFGDDRSGHVTSVHSGTTSGKITYRPLAPATQYQRVDVPPAHEFAQGRSSPTKNVYRRHAAPDKINVVRYDFVEGAYDAQKSQQFRKSGSSDQWADVTQLSPEHSRVPPDFDPTNQWPDSQMPVTQPSALFNQYGNSSFSFERHTVRQRTDQAPPVSYYQNASRAHYVVPENGVEGLASSSSWSHTRRKNSASIAVQTDNALDSFAARTSII